VNAKTQRIDKCIDHMRRASSALVVVVLVLVGACGTNVVAAGRLGETVDPSGGERWFTLSDLESGGLVLHALGQERHAGALFDVYTTRDTLGWQACTEAVLDAGMGEPIAALVVRRDFETERGVLGNLMYVERVSFVVYDPELAHVAATPRLVLDICGYVATLDGKVQASLSRFAGTVLAAHEGQGWLPPLVIPSEE